MIPVIRMTSPEDWVRIKPASVEAEEEGIWSRVEKIINDVKARGDQALVEYTELFDGCAVGGKLAVRPEEIEEATRRVSGDFLAALRQAKENILAFHRQQKQKDWFIQDTEGSIVGQICRPIDRVGVYVPGGTANYPSTVLMTCLPAVVAGVPEIVLVTPPNRDGYVPDATLAAAGVAGVNEVYRVGGVQAIAALAYGTETIRAVDKIVGPGNIYVTLAKKMVFGQVGIDMLAGPSEILIIGDGSVKAAYAAADLLSQAEHDVRAKAVLLTPDPIWAQEVAQAVEDQLAGVPRQSLARAALERNGAIFVVQSLEEAFAAANRIAPEHLELLIAEPWSHLAKVRHAGAVFLGPHSPEPVGDYWAGTNHVLPTGSGARFSSALTVDDYCKRSNIISYTRAGLDKAAPGIEALAAAENLAAHGAAIAIRRMEG